MIGMTIGSGGGARDVLAFRRGVRGRAGGHRGNGFVALGTGGDGANAREHADGSLGVQHAGAELAVSEEQRSVSLLLKRRLRRRRRDAAIGLGNRALGLGARGGDSGVEIGREACEGRGGFLAEGVVGCPGRGKEQEQRGVRGGKTGKDTAVSPRRFARRGKGWSGAATHLRPGTRSSNASSAFFRRAFSSVASRKDSRA